MDDITIKANHSIAKQNLWWNKQRDTDRRRDQSKSRNTQLLIKSKSIQFARNRISTKRDKSLLNPFYFPNYSDSYFSHHREYPWSSIETPTKSICAFVIFISLVIMTGTLIVYYRSPKPTGMFVTSLEETSANT